MRHLQSLPDITAWLRARVSGSLQVDSRRVRPGDAFIAWPGAATDGRRFVADVLAAGAAAVLVEQEGVDAWSWEDERIAVVSGLKSLTGLIASDFHGEPSGSLDMVAFTGTNGKTSSAWWMAQLLCAAGRPCAVIGTLGMGRPPVGPSAAGATLTPTGLTTPDPVILQRQLRRFVDEGDRACAIEASSIGLVEHRLTGCRIRVGVFTNFTQDHLDYHGDMERYWAAKQVLFDWPGLQAAVVNLDDPRGAALAAHVQARGLDVWTVGIDCPQARLQAHSVSITPEGFELTLREDGQDHPLTLPMVGRYNVSNLLGVLAASRALGVPLQEAVNACDLLGPVPGRMEAVHGRGSGLEPLVLVDYAHTPDALQQALQALQPLARRRAGRLWVVIGCGGDRDPGKRPQMAAAAETLADQVVLTSDNPRSEDPQTILDQMRDGLRHPDRVTFEVDRARAIGLAAARAQVADVVLVAGKGHEDYQEVQGVRRPFSDRDEVRAALLRRCETEAAT
ncbi:MAG: UDP-N-acetylmuramoyl-L-alanyl-D-glutamate--2,6-diaminopimelate ligase [Burkholderiales bacterium]|nr:MAG: UDP-N-acetylmuramoyl-L-alanyl-D-glutamate--2,6-diaminopimelate ligase [Burkholderiales bacterium]